MARSSSPQSKVRADLPALRCSARARNTSASCRNFLSPLAALAAFSTRRFTISRSAMISSRSMVSMSPRGSTGTLVPASATTCMMFSSSKQRTTWTMASVRRMFSRNLLPRPALAGALHQARNVHKFDDGGGSFCRADTSPPAYQALHPARPPCPRWARWCRRGSWRFRLRRW